MRLLRAKRHGNEITYQLFFLPPQKSLLYVFDISSLPNLKIYPSFILYYIIISGITQDNYVLFCSYTYDDLNFTCVCVCLTHGINYQACLGSNPQSRHSRDLDSYRKRRKKAKKKGSWHRHIGGSLKRFCMARSEIIQVPK